MARAKDLAALAGLAGLAYAMRNKSKPNEDAGDQKTSSYTGDTKKVEAKDTKDTAEAPTADEGTKSNVLKAITAKREAPNDQAPTQGVLDTPAPAKPVPSLKAAGASAASNKTDAMRNASRKAAAALKNKTPPAATKSETPAAPKPTTRPTTRPLNILEEAKEEARRRAAASQATPTSTSSSTSPTTRYSFPGSSALNKKNGGAVKKMASGGMTASSRADGIASRGKTRCKMY